MTSRSKSPRQRVRPKPGDVIEFTLLNKKLAYFQYVKHHTAPPGLGALIRILPDLFDERPKDPAALAQQEELWMSFIPLGAACAQDEHVRIVATAPIPERFQQWPKFKAFNENLDTGKRTWFIWDGMRYTKIGDLPAEAADWSFPETINLTALEERLLSGWHPRDEVSDA